MLNRRTHVGSVLAAGVALLAAGGACAAPPPLHVPENGLLGIRLMDTYRDVLRKYGQPNEVQISGPGMPGTVASAAPGAAGGPGGGAPGAPGAPVYGGPNYGPGSIGRMGGFPELNFARRGAGQAGGAGRLPGFGGPGEDYSGGYSGQAPGSRPAPGGLPGFGGVPSPAGSSGFPGGPAAGGAAEGDQSATTAEETWWYHDRKKAIHKAFLFNKEGRVIQIQEYGWRDTPTTQLGVHLGSNLGEVIRKYGWSSDGEHMANQITLRYGVKNKLGFQLVNNKVVGITIAVYNQPKPPEEAAASLNPGGPGR